MRMNSIKKIRR